MSDVKKRYLPRQQALGQTIVTVSVLSKTQVLLSDRWNACSLLGFLYRELFLCQSLPTSKLHMNDNGYRRLNGTLYHKRLSKRRDKYVLYQGNNIIKCPLSEESEIGLLPQWCYRMTRKFNTPVMRWSINLALARCINT
jgi:hypothetical protein